MLAKMLLDPVTQIEFNKKKGSIPVRTDVDVSSLDICAQKGAKMAADPAQQAPSQELLTPPAVTGAIEDVISSYWNTPSQTVDQFADKFARGAEVRSDPQTAGPRLLAARGHRRQSFPARITEMLALRPRLASRLAAWIALSPALADLPRRLCRLHRLDDLDLVDLVANAAELQLRRASPSTSACSPTSAGSSRSRTSPSSACCS